MALKLAQPLNRNEYKKVFLGGKARLARKAGNLAAIREPMTELISGMPATQFGDESSGMGGSELVQFSKRFVGY
jgi:hypothetical protein